MRNLLWPVLFASIATMPGFSVHPSVPRTPLRPVGNEAGQPRADQDKKEPTFEETKAFILRHTSKAWEESPGNRHAYTLTFINKRLRYSDKFTSKFTPGYLEKREVELSALDPTLVGQGDQALHSLLLATTNGERKISVEVTLLDPVADPAPRKGMERTMSAPSADTDPDAQDKMDERLKKAWAHLIKLAGGKPGQEEPF